jgi:hypothetical protein
MRLTLSGTPCIALFAMGFLLVGALTAWAEDTAPPVSPGSVNSATGTEISRLKSMLATQQKQLEEQEQQIEKMQRALDLERQQLETFNASLPTTRSRAPTCTAGEMDCAQHVEMHAPGHTIETKPERPLGGLMASTSPALTPPLTTAPAALPPYTAAPSPPQTGEPPAPPYIRIGDAYITPIGFMDFTTVFRSAAAGSGIGTNFGATPFNSVPTARLTEVLPNPQNSRIGMRVDTKVHGWRIIGYWESDFLGNNPTNVAVTSNSDTFRLRLYWVDLRKNKWEILGGQSWSLLTPGRVGISPLPADIFYSYVVDVNYIVGLTWGRTPQFRLVYHPKDWLAAGFSLEEPQQYIGGSGGQGSITFPTNSNIAATYANQLDNGTTTFNVPNLIPDVIGKVAFDPKTSKLHQHIEAVGLYREFKVWNPANNRYFTNPGGGGALNMNFEVARDLHLIGNFFASDGGGRWLFGSGPDLIIRGDGSISPIGAYATTSGVEYTRGNTLLYAYYGADYFNRNTTIDLNGKLVGYGYSGSPNTQNRTIQEATGGFIQTFWKNPNWGALQFMFQYAYFVRNPWFVAVGQPKNADNSTVFVNLRYALPGNTPNIK